MSCRRAVVACKSSGHKLEHGEGRRNARSRAFERPTHQRRKGPQRGIALLLALIVMALMGLAAAAQMRAIDTTTRVGGNLALHTTALAWSTAALEDAIAALYENGAIADRQSDLPAHGYYASLQANADSRGVPQLLLQDPPGTDGVRVMEAIAGNTARYVIERLCATSGAASEASCNLTRPYPPGGAGDEVALNLEAVTAYRVTVRIDGPQHTLAYAQMLVRGSSPPQRLGWRVLDE